MEYTIIEHNVETNEVIERPATEMEIARFEQAKANAIAQAAEAEAKEAARQALLEKLGITADEAKLLLG